MEIIQTRTDIGLVRKKNEDVVSYVNHPRNKNIKLLIAADGMGGRDLGDVAASYVTSSLNVESSLICSAVAKSTR